ncbi:MAG TPA: hypothetical protein VLT62_21370 [Candidatus Methylomirabilis sp.]|nr:hypothetical protein [Candidatus Methylomirabilis sp.]
MRVLSRNPGSASATRIPAYGIILFVALAAFWGIHGLTRGVEHLGGDQHLNLVLVLEGEDPTLFSRDLVFGGQDVTSEYIPLYIGFLRLAYRVFGDLATGYKLLVFPLTILYLCGAYFVFLRCCRMPGVAVALAVFSSFLQSVPLAEEFFGVGPIGWVVARTIMTSAFPFLFLAFSSWIDRPRKLLLVFLAIGLLANVHPVSSLDVAAFLGITYLLEMGGSLRSWGILAGMGGATLVGAAPIFWAQLHHMAKQTAVAQRPEGTLVARIVKEHLGFILYPPPTFSSLAPVVVHGLTLALMAFSVVVVAPGWHGRRESIERWACLVAAGSVAYLLFPEARLLCTVLVFMLLLPQKGTGPREGRLGVYLSLAVFWVTLGELIAFQFGPPMLQRPSLSIIFTRGARFAVFALFLLLALAVRLADWSRVRGVPNMALITLILLTGVWQVRHTVRTHLRTRGNVAAADLAALSKWAREETGPQDLFLFDSAAFRVMARRALVFTTKDHGPIIFNRPDRAGAWLEREEALRAAGADPRALVRLGVRYGAQFVVIPAASIREAKPANVRYANGTYVVLATGVVFP